jgi:NADH:ubiquinone oxidoreductase subunit 6 (subunit J)
MTTLQVMFILVGLITVVGGLYTVLARNLFHAALGLVVSLAGVAALYALMEAAFLAAAQVLIYIGAIAILIIFAVMLTEGVMGRYPRANDQWGYAIVVALGLLAVLLITLYRFNWPQGAPAAVPADSIARLGQSLVEPNLYVIPFEVASVLLVAALIGSVYIARDKKVEKKTGEQGGK